MSVTSLDARFAAIVDADAEVQTLSDAFGFTEGPVWHPGEQHVTFSDIPASRLYRWSEASGVSVYREPTNMSNGNTYDASGRIISCEHASSFVTREAIGGQQVLASHYEGKELNSPNDVVVRSDGMIFFTDPTYGRRGQHGVEREVELGFQGVYQLHPDSLELTLLSKDFETPNGLCFSLDETRMYVADTQRREIRLFDVTETALTGGDVFAQSPAPDGLKIDTVGNVYAGGPGGVFVYAPDGTHLGIIHAPAFCANFTWGGVDMLSLFMTASTGLFRVQVNIPGKPLF